MDNTPKITPKIAIVGTEGSGKTILASVLAKRMSSSTEGIFLHPRDWETSDYVEKVWNTLNNGEWWKSTEAGCTFELQWTLHIGQVALPMKLIDSAGQDLRELFSKDTYKKKNLSGIQRELLDYIQTASVIIIIVNLLHFRGEPDNIKRKQNEFILKEVIDMFAADEKHQDIAVIFTAWDLYYYDIAKNYGNFTKYLQQELPQLYNAMRLGQQSGDSLHCFPVSAVMDTELVNNVRVPKPQFRSGGLDTLGKWLINIVQRERNKEYAEKQAKDYEIKMRQINKWLIPAMCGVVAGTGCFFASGMIGVGIGGLVAGLALGKVGMILLDPKNNDEKNQTTESNEKSQQNNEKTKPSETTRKTKQPEYPNIQKYNINIDSDDLIVGEENVDDVVLEDNRPSERKSKSIKF
ncbi:MAG: hypothetical protein LBT09_09665 [Planctomycetaceae bacterium]|nr:hypothetical protein [Planctomycetaceae bacterium]